MPDRADVPVPVPDPVADGNGAPASTGLRGQARRGAERREEIIDAAIEVFATRGFRSSALKEVADRVGVSPANLLYHFGSKQGLLLAVIAERDRRAGLTMLELSTSGPLQSIRDGVHFAQESERERGLAALHTVLQAESFEPGAPAHDYFLGRSRNLRELTQRSLEAGQAIGEVRADVDGAAKARELVAFLEGAAVLWLIDPEVSLVELYRNYLDGFVRSVATDPDAFPPA